jgi:alpha-glucosidase
VDGFRIDVVHLLGKDPALPDGPGRQPAIGETWTTHQILRDIRRLLDSYPGERTSVGEVYILDTPTVVRYYGDQNELHLAFNFPPLHAPWSAEAWRSQIKSAEATFIPASAWPTWVLSNHDTPRHRTRYGSESRARAAAVMLLTLRGTPFLYAGEELGLEDAVVEAEAVRDPGGRDGCRAPLPWEPEAHHGWTAGQPWLPWPPDPDTRNVRSESRDPQSTAALYRRLLSLRRARSELRTGDFALLDTPGDVVGYIRGAGAQAVTVLVNFSAQLVSVPDRTGQVVLASDGKGEGAPWGGTLGPDQAVVIVD